MYTASAAFHQAIRQNAPQRALLIFADAFFTNEDINVERGIEFTDTFNEETDLSIGQALSNEITFTLFNDDGLLDGFDFGRFTATIGARIAQTTYKQHNYVTVQSANNTYYGNKKHPYLTRNGETMSVLFPVHSVFILDDTVHVFGEKGYYAAFSDSTGAAKSISTNSFMMNKASRLDAVGMYYSSSTRKMYEYQGGIIGEYEFVPLGVFTAVRPNVGTTIEIDFTCNDQMNLFDKDFTDGPTITYPTTIRGILDALCSYVGVSHGATSFINSSATISAQPEAFEKATLRQIIGWIAEAACANARFDRDGILQLEWLNPTQQVFDEHDYVQFNPYWFAVPSVSRLYNRKTSENIEEVQGSGSNGYLIQDNPLLDLKQLDFAITTQPTDQTVTAGGTASFTCAAQGGDVAFQWQTKSSDWTDISGATSGTYSFTATANDDGRRFRCKVTLGEKKKYSDGVTLHVTTGS